MSFSQRPSQSSCRGSEVSCCSSGVMLVHQDDAQRGEKDSSASVSYTCALPFRSTRYSL